MGLSPKFPPENSAHSFSKYIGRDEIKGIIGSLGHSISQKYQNEELYIVANLKGSFIFLADLVREIRNVKVYLDFVSLRAIGRGQEHNGTIGLKKDISHDLFDKRVLIVEEIIDTGRALRFLKERLELAQPKSIEVVTLFDKPYKRAVPIVADYIGKKLDDYFIVGYGLDLEEYCRNLRDVYHLRYPN